MLVLGLSFAASSYLIYDSFRKWQNAPVIVSFSEKSIDIWEFPFPAITICPVIDKNASQNMELEFPGLINETLKEVEWIGKKNDSYQFFTEIITSEGLCFTFNMQSFDDLFQTGTKFEAMERLKGKPDSDWSLPIGYEITASAEAYPYRAFGSGEKAGLSFVIHREIEEISKREDLEKGFKLALHLPCEIPQFDKDYFRVPLQKSFNVIARTSLIEADNLRSYSLETRQCYMEDEMKLEIFKTYSQNNCAIECLISKIRKFCKCVPKFLPRMGDDRICNASEYDCFEEARYSLNRDKLDYSLNKALKNHPCECLPECTQVHFESETSQDDFSAEQKSIRT